jgi:hypothetical protein
MNHRILISTAATCALCATIAGTAAAMPDSIDGPVPEGTSLQRVAASAADAPMGADELSLFHQRAHRLCMERAVDASSAPMVALDGVYGLPRRTASASITPQWVTALAIRSEALNRKYQLGVYAGVAH